MPRLPARALLLLATATLLAGCARAPDAPPVLGVEPWHLPAGSGSAQPDLSKVSASDLLLSWVDKDAAGQRLRFAQFSAFSGWSTPLTIATGDYFGSSVDTPHVRVIGIWRWAQWLRKSPAGGHARDVVLAQSRDAGASWSEPQPVNLDGTPTEHGFVAMWPVGAEGVDGVGMAWLDGRATHAAMAAGTTHAAMAEGATMVRSARFDAALARHDETTVDARSCDCCQMDAAMTLHGPLLVYRDRAPGEVRDIAVVSQREGRWSPARPVHADGWVMSACPINGPAVAAVGDSVAVAWYTGAGGSPSVRLALSTDAGEHFAAPLSLARGDAVLGNVDVAIEVEAAWVLWLEARGNGQSLQLARVSRGDGRVERIEVAKLEARGRGAGQPKLVLLAGQPHVAWTDADGDVPSLHGAVVTRGGLRARP